MSGSPFLILETIGASQLPLQDPTTFGRAEDNGVPLKDASVSSHHAAIRKDGAFWIVEDLGSTNGTWLNHKRVDGKAVIKEGDQIQMGSQMIRVGGFRGSGDRRAPAPAQSCLQCAKALPADSAFCPHCGIPTAPPAEGAAPLQPPLTVTAPFTVPRALRQSRSSRLRVGWLLTGVALVLLGLVIGWWMRGGCGRNPAPGRGGQSALEAAPGGSFRARASLPLPLW